MSYPQKKTLTKKKEGMRDKAKKKEVMRDKAKKKTGNQPQSFQDSVNVGLANYQKTSTPAKSLGSQANINSLPSVYDIGFKNKTIKKLSESQVMGEAIKGIIKSVL
jgi:hypothetical protein